MIEYLRKLGENNELIISLKAISLCPNATYPENLTKVVASLNYVLPRLVAYLQYEFNNHHTTDFIQISMDATSALSPDETMPSELAMHLDYKLHHLLIDEFQDTSLQQLHLIERLTQGWLANEQKSIFVVGDPMQSIYRFRQAEVSLFL